jgi:regulator of sirC expression with transglutaminase-like and TPR domain
VYPETNKSPLQLVQRVAFVNNHFVRMKPKAVNFDMNTPENPLSESEFKALLRLLDDEDEEVTAHVWSTLLALGESGMERLEAEWLTATDPEMQRKLEEVINRIHRKGVANELLEWRKDGGRDLLRGWFLVSKFQFPDLDYQKYRNEINRLVNKTWLELSNGMDPSQKLRVVNHILFKMEGYGPNTTRPNFPHNSHLNYLIDHQQGNAPSLALLYLIICKQLDMPVSGVILPGYFILLYKDDKHEFYIDVFNGGHTFNRARLEGYLKQVNVPEKPSYFTPTSNIYIILNLIRTIAHDYAANDKQDKVDELEELLQDIDIKFEI